MEREIRTSYLSILLFLVVMMLVGFGFGFLISATQQASANTNSVYSGIALKQGVFLAIGFVAMLIGAFVPYGIYKRHIKGIFLVTSLMLIVTLLFGKEIYGAKRWLEFAGVSVQPSEFAKFVIVVYLASFLSSNDRNLRNFYSSTLPALCMVGFLCGLIILEKDFSTTMLVGATAFLILMLSGVRVSTLLMMLLIGALMAFVFIFNTPYRIKRIVGFLNPWEDPLGTGWQTIQSLKCFALGGVTGSGLGESVQKFYALPKGYNDYIFSIIAEEAGVFGAFGFLVGYLALFFIGMNIAKRSKDSYGYLLASGISILVFMQAIFNIGVSIGLFPSTGITLPLVSSGGSSLVAFMFMFGVVINIAYRSERGIEDLR